MGRGKKLEVDKNFRPMPIDEGDELYVNGIFVFNVIDGNHRLEGAYRYGVEKISGARVSADQHLPFLTSKKAYTLYIDFWNSKIQERVDEFDASAERNPPAAPNNDLRAKIKARKRG